MILSIGSFVVYSSGVLSLDYSMLLYMCLPCCVYGQLLWRIFLICFDVSMPSLMCQYDYKACVLRVDGFTFLTCCTEMFILLFCYRVKVLKTHS